MYSTNKELIVYINQRVQQITGNRHRSLPDELIDMALNSTALKYIDAKLDYKTNGALEGAEQTNKRVDMFRSLKKETPMLQLFYDSVDYGYLILPSDYLRFFSLDGQVTFSKDVSALANQSSITYSGTVVDLSNINYLTEAQASNVTTAILQVITNPGVSPIINDIDITDLIPFITQSDDDEGTDSFEFVNALRDRLHNLGANAYWEWFLGTYYKQSYVINYDRKHVAINPNIIIDGTTFNIGITQSLISRTLPTYLPEQAIPINAKRRNIDIVSSEDSTVLRNNYYQNRNRHMNPMGELMSDRIKIYIGDNYKINRASLVYYKQPQLFISSINQMSDLTITQEFLEMVEAEIKLMLKDDTYNIVKQNSNQN